MSHDSRKHGNEHDRRGAPLAPAMDKQGIGHQVDEEGRDHAGRQRDAKEAPGPVYEIKPQGSQQTSSQP